MINPLLERYKGLIETHTSQAEFDEVESKLNEKLEINEWLKQYNINTLFDLQKVFLGFPQMKEKAEKYDNLMNANSEVVKSNITLTEAQQQIKQLKEEKIQLIDYMEALKFSHPIISSEIRRILRMKNELD